MLCFHEGYASFPIRQERMSSRSLMSGLAQQWCRHCRLGRPLSRLYSAATATQPVASSETSSSTRAAQSEANRQQRKPLLPFSHFLTPSSSSSSSSLKRQTEPFDEAPYLPSFSSSSSTAQKTYHIETYGSAFHSFAFRVREKELLK